MGTILDIKIACGVVDGRPTDFFTSDEKADRYFNGVMVNFTPIKKGVSLNGGTPNLHPKMIISSRKTPWVCWVPPF